MNRDKLNQHAVRAWINHRIHRNAWDVIRHLRHNFNGGSTVPPLKLVVTLDINIWICLLTNVVTQLNHVSKRDLCSHSCLCCVSNSWGSPPSKVKLAYIRESWDTCRRLCLLQTWLYAPNSGPNVSHISFARAGYPITRMQEFHW